MEYILILSMLCSNAVDKKKCLDAKIECVETLEVDFNKRSKKEVYSKMDLAVWLVSEPKQDAKFCK